MMLENQKILALHRILYYHKESCKKKEDQTEFIRDSFIFEKVFFLENLLCLVTFFFSSEMKLAPKVTIIGEF